MYFLNKANLCSFGDSNAREIIILVPFWSIVLFFSEQEEDAEEELEQKEFKTSHSDKSSKIGGAPSKFVIYTIYCMTPENIGLHKTLLANFCQIFSLPSSLPS